LMWTSWKQPIASSSFFTTFINRSECTKIWELESAYCHYFLWRRSLSTAGWPSVLRQQAWGNELWFVPNYNKSATACWSHSFARSGISRNLRHHCGKSNKTIPLTNHLRHSELNQPCLYEDTSRRSTYSYHTGQVRNPALHNHEGIRGATCKWEDWTFSGCIG
jgi:hypothetical protein